MESPIYTFRCERVFVLHVKYFKHKLNNDALIVAAFLYCIRSFRRLVGRLVVVVCLPFGAIVVVDVSI